MIWPKVLTKPYCLKLVVMATECSPDSTAPPDWSAPRGLDLRLGSCDENSDWSSVVFYTCALDSPLPRPTLPFPLVCSLDNHSVDFCKEKLFTRYNTPPPFSLNLTRLLIVHFPLLTPNLVSLLEYRGRCWSTVAVNSHWSYCTILLLL